ncbi:hypothetical protein G4H71_03895 [Rhodococcus triatomae]|uniref:Uncharacterized protein n=1 Tax=Rhodococcus triatomae TaxID=300028 RepID=A0A1G7ZGG1_9NOCA|nr:hypothetical protein [Rhodococcus triatomae]QNG18043.1 hypothetical protein G4H72_04145 [Rhodococcus triatomae]QNG22286.1 hypothetical protein G4H71_03895 [Rhodococcus triatomae]SDH07831.1 hypothetical protein SAMN05444695_101105 [Rhodococcus triatomae]
MPHLHAPDRATPTRHVSDAAGPQRSILSIRSEGSILSIGSAYSILSIGSVGSILSVGSMGSFGSVLSSFSFGSLGSAFSAVSRWSLLSWRGNHSSPADQRPPLVVIADEHDTEDHLAAHCQC